MENRLCLNCFAEFLPDGVTDVCPVCGWDNSRAQIRGGLRYHTVLASRYLIGRAKAMNGEGITYAALDQTTKKVVEIREFFPASLASRDEDGECVVPNKGSEADFDSLLNDFIQLSRGVSRLRELSVVCTILEIFQENYTAYAVYEYVPAMSLKRYVQNEGGSLSWNEAHRLFAPVLTALGLINSLGIAHLGISPDTLRVTKAGSMLITGFSINDARRAGTPLSPELYPGCAAIEQYSASAICGETSDVYGFAATLLFALTGNLPDPAPQRSQDQRLMISREVLKTLPPFAITAIANAMQVEPDSRTVSFERFKTELSAAPTIVNEVTQTDAIRRLPPLDVDLQKSRGLPPVVWLIGSCAVTLVALLIVAFTWLGDRGMSFQDISQLFVNESSAAESVPAPNMVNQSYQDWVDKLNNGEYDFKLKVSEQIFSETVAEGNIISQAPFGGENIQPGSEILVTVSRGSPTRILPAVKGVSFADLYDALQKNGFEPVKEEEASDEVEVGYVIRYKDHEEGDSLDYGSTVTVIVSSGSESP